MITNHSYLMLVACAPIDAHQAYSNYMSTINENNGADSNTRCKIL